jgi:5'-nucleotidase/UDP-sugar diphosphatase
MRKVFTAIALFIFGCGGYDTSNFQLTIFHTNDRHSHFLGLPNGDFRSDGTADGTSGGAARWMNLVQQERQQNQNVLLVDGGDFTMGTMLVTAHQTAADLDFMKEFGYFAAVPGNHEFDWEEDGLARMIQAAQKPMVPLVLSNIHFNQNHPGDDRLAALYGEPGQSGKYIFPYFIGRTEGGIKVGVLGLLGLDAANVSNARAAYFSRTIEELAGDAQTQIDHLRDLGAQVVICLAHLGTDVQNDQVSGESIELARRTRGIDVIISGHTHTDTSGAHAVASQVDPSWTTWVAEAGYYGTRLGKIVFSRQGSARSASGVSLVIGDSLVQEAQVNSFISKLIDDVEQNFLKALMSSGASFLNGDFHQVLTHSSYDLVRRENENGNLGYLVADAMREASGAQMAFASNGGDLRASLPRTGDNGISLQDAFIVTPLGTGPDGELGYPLVSFYLRLVELQLLMEATVCGMGLTNNDYMINMSGIRAVVDSSRSGTYSCVRRIYFTGDQGDEGQGTLIYDADQGGFLLDQFTTLYQVCTSSYIADKMGQFNVYPKDSSGKQISLEEALVKKNGKEVKLWQALASRLAKQDPLSNVYHEVAAENPLGPYYRRLWDLNRHPCQEHAYCK